MGNLPKPGGGRAWQNLSHYLQTTEAGWIVDGAVTGELPISEVEDILASFDIEPDMWAKRMFGRLVDHLIREGVA